MSAHARWRLRPFRAREMPAQNVEGHVNFDCRGKCPHKQFEEHDNRGGGKCPHAKDGADFLQDASSQIRGSSFLAGELFCTFCSVREFSNAASTALHRASTVSQLSRLRLSSVFFKSSVCFCDTDGEFEGEFPLSTRNSRAFIHRYLITTGKSQGLIPNQIRRPLSAKRQQC